jgi:hypothetical protein
VREQLGLLLLSILEDKVACQEFAEKSIGVISPGRGMTIQVIGSLPQTPFHYFNECFAAHPADDRTSACNVAIWY